MGSNISLFAMNGPEDNDSATSVPPKLKKKEVVRPSIVPELDLSVLNHEPPKHSKQKKSTRVSRHERKRRADEEKRRKDKEKRRAAEKKRRKDKEKLKKELATYWEDLATYELLRRLVTEPRTKKSTYELLHELLSEPGMKKSYRKTESRHAPLQSTSPPKLEITSHTKKRPQPTPELSPESNISWSSIYPSAPSPKAERKSKKKHLKERKNSSQHSPRDHSNTGSQNEKKPKKGKEN